MNFCDINPFIRFAEKIYYQSESELVMVMDCRLFYVISGKADIFIEDQHYELIPDSLFYCCRGQKYSISSEGVHLICLNFDLNQMDNHLTSNLPRINLKTDISPYIPKPYNVNDSRYINSFLFILHGSFLLKSFENILNEYSTKLVHYQETCSGLLKIIMVQLHRHSLEGSRSATDAVNTLISYMKENYTDNITNELLSEITGYHKYHLNRLFTKHTGTTVHKYLIGIRIDEAKKLLLNTPLSLSEIAERTGFNSNTHFSNYFKQFVGISPLAFRKQYRNNI